MTLETLANLGEFLGGVVVIISVFYLALQIRQNTIAQRTQNYAVALDRIGEFQARMSHTGAFADILVNGAEDPARLTAQERIQFTWAFYEMFGAFEFMFLQTRAGAMPREVWQRWSDTLQWWMAFPGVRAWWQSRPTPFTRGFEEHVDALAAAGTPSPAASRRWADFLASGSVPSPSKEEASRA